MKACGNEGKRKLLLKGETKTRQEGRRKWKEKWRCVGMKERKRELM